MTVGLFVLLACAGTVSAQSAGVEAERAARVAALIELAQMEYADAVANGTVIDAAEYEEAGQFAAEAGRELERLVDPRGAAGGADEILTAAASLIQAMADRVEPVSLSALAAGLVTAVSARWSVTAVRLPEARPSLARGASIYAVRCASCHGPAGAGDGRLAASLDPPPADLVRSPRGAEATAARDWQVVSYGIPATTMEGWASLLSGEERWDVVVYVQTLRFSDGDVARGRTLASSKHSPFAGVVRPLSDQAEVAHLTDPELVAVATAFTGEVVGPGDDTALAAWLRTVAGSDDADLPAADPRWSVDRNLAAVNARLDEVIAASADGRSDDARSAAIDAYMSFERLESELGARRPDLARAVESGFARLRADIETSPGTLAATRSDLDARLARSRAALLEDSSSTTLAGQSFFIILREGFEAILIIGAIMTFLVKTGNGHLRREVVAGVLAALLASVATAIVLEAAFDAAPARQELLEGIAMLAAVVVLFSVSYWLMSKLDREKWNEYLRARVETAVGKGGGAALSLMAFLAVYREGFETVLFYKALTAYAPGRNGPIVLGFVAGCVALAAIYVGFRKFGLRIPMRPFFAMTSGVLYAMAVVFAGSAVRELQEAGAVRVTPVAGVPEAPLVGLYPTVETLAAQAVLLALLVGALAFTFRPAQLRSARLVRSSRVS